MALEPRFKAVAFDMDGTFMRTEIDYVKLSNVIFDELIEIGVPLYAINRSGGSRSELESGVAWLEKHGRKAEAESIRRRISGRSTMVEMEYAERSRPFDGAEEVVRKLRGKGYKTAILTRGGHSYAEFILKRSNVLELFDAVVARDDFPDEEAKPSPKAMVNLGNILGLRPEEILFLGDSIMDWLTARDSGAGFYGVLTGGNDADDWKNADPNIKMLKSVASLLEMI